jgi:hypothetical protein
MPQNDGQIEPFVADLKEQVEHVAVRIGQRVEEASADVYGGLIGGLRLDDIDE